MSASDDPAGSAPNVSPCGTAQTRRSPRGARPRVGAMLVVAQVSLRNTRRQGSSVGCNAVQAARAPRLCQDDLGLSIILRSVLTRSRKNDASSTTPTQAFVAQATNACSGDGMPRGKSSMRRVRTGAGETPGCGGRTGVPRGARTTGRRTAPCQSRLAPLRARMPAVGEKDRLWTTTRVARRDCPEASSTSPPRETSACGWSMPPDGPSGTGSPRSCRGPRAMATAIRRATKALVSSWSARSR